MRGREIERLLASGRSGGLGSSAMAPTTLPASEGQEVTLVMTRSTLWLRLRLNWVALRRRLGWLVAAGFVLPTVILFATLLGESWSFELGRGELFLLTAGANVGLFLGIAVVSALLHSLFPSASELLLPEVLIFRRASLRVKPRVRDAFETSYAFILDATRTATGLDLKIGEAPLLIVHVTPQAVGAHNFEMLRFWLQRQGKLQ